jgi:Transglycosylase-like domain/Putative peptidoglycan binding domain
VTTPIRDLSSPIPWRRSLRAAQQRRATQARRRRRTVRGRTSALLSIAALAAGASAALAQDAATPNAPASSAATLQMGAQGAGVRLLQQKLGAVADGIFGPKTRAAVKRFQRRSGLEPSGVAGPSTLAALGLGGQALDAAAAAAAAGPSVASGRLEAIARCESGGNPAAVSRTGRYRGKYQFDRPTWRAAGGTGDPAAAPEAEQDRVAAQLLAQRGTAPWPNCG